MSVETRNPSGFAPTTSSQVAIARGTRIVYLSGQVALDARGEVVSRRDLAAQAEQAYLNVGAALKAVGATFQDVAKMTVFVVDWTPAKIESLVAARCAADGSASDAKRPMTLIGVAALRDAGLPDRGRSGSPVVDWT